jgi:ribosomal protein S18 acetylase RimI-like enzyme
MAPTAMVVTAALPREAPPANNTPMQTTEDEFQIRSYAPQDHKAVCDLFTDGMLLYRPPAHEDAFLYDYFTQFVDQCFHDDLGDIEATYMASGGHFWVVPATDPDTGREEIAAMIALERKADGVGEVRRLSVGAKYRCYGLGAQLVGHVEQWATARGFTSLQLNTEITMARALKLYDRLGYTRTHHETIREDPPYYLVWFRKLLV